MMDRKQLFDAYIVATNTLSDGDREAVIAYIRDYRNMMETHIEKLEKQLEQALVDLDYYKYMKNRIGDLTKLFEDIKAVLDRSTTE